MPTRRSAKKPNPSTHSSMETRLSKRKKKADTTVAETAVAATFADGLTYDILGLIFKNLNIRDLGNAATVCRFWSEVAKIEKKVRSRPELTSLCNLKHSWKYMHPGKEFIDHFKFKPMLHLVFFGNPSGNTHPVREKKKNCPCKTLPSSCQNIIIGNYGIITDQIELENVKQKAACLLLPEEQGVTIETISANEPSWCGMSRRYSVAELRKKALAKNNVKCFIILTNNNTCYPQHHVVDNLPNDNRSVSGGSVTSLKVCKDQECYNVVWAAILISGPSVESWSVVMTESCNTKEKVEAKLMLLKEKVKLKKHSVAFMFACQRRGVSMFNEKNVESTIFKKLFPDVPLIGSFGGTEFGSCQVEPTEKRTFQYSTVFMIVTYGKL